MSTAKKLSSSFIIFILFFISQSDICSAGIVPCGTSANPKPCTICHLILGIQNLINWGKNILVIATIVGTVIAGLLYMISSGSEKMITASKSCFKASLVGFAITLAAWLAINSIIMYLLVPSGNEIGAKAKSWNSFTCDTASSASTGTSSDSSRDPKQNAEKLAECNKWCTDNKADDSTAEGKKYNSECLTGCSQQFGPNGVPDPNGNGMTGTDAKQALNKCGVGSANINTLNGVQNTTVNEICKFKGASGCDTLITSGTSGTHKTASSCTHENGCKFDFTPNSCNDAWISNNYSPTGTRSDGAACYSAPSGACYAREGNHWDMSTTRSCKAQGC